MEEFSLALLDRISLNPQWPSGCHRHHFSKKRNKGANEVTCSSSQSSWGPRSASSRPGVRGVNREGEVSILEGAERPAWGPCAGGGAHPQRLLWERTKRNSGQRGLPSKPLLGAHIWKRPLTPYARLVRGLG